MEPQTSAPKQHDGGKGLTAALGDHDFPLRLLEAAEDFKSALSNCSIRDEEQRNAIIIYAAQLDMFDMVEEKNDLTNMLRASISINMASRAQALQGHVGIFWPSTSGMKVGKEEQQFMAGANKAAAKARRNHDEEDKNEE